MENGKFQTNILRQLSFQTQNLKQNILNKIQKFDNKGQDQTEPTHKSGDKIYVCEECGYEANSKSLLKSIFIVQIVEFPSTRENS
jgi:hypothetical protein